MIAWVDTGTLLGELWGYLVSFLGALGFIRDALGGHRGLFRELWGSFIELVGSSWGCWISFLEPRCENCDVHENLSVSSLFLFVFEGLGVIFEAQGSSWGACWRA